MYLAPRPATTGRKGIPNPWVFLFAIWGLIGLAGGSLSSIAVAASATTASDASATVRVRGQVMREAGQNAWLIKDATGEVVVHLNQALEARIGDTLEVLGAPNPTGPTRTLTNCAAQLLGLKSRPSIANSEQTPSTAPPDDYLPLLTLIRQVRELTPEEAARGYPARIRGVATYCDERTGQLFIQDDTGAIYVVPKEFPKDLHSGDVIEAEGFSDPGGFAPIVTNAQLSRQATSRIPSAKPVSPDALLTGTLDCQLVEVRGVVRSARLEGNRLLLGLYAGRRSLPVRVGTTTNLPTAHRLIDSEVRVTAVCASRFNNRRQLLGVILLVPGLSQIEQVAAAPGEPFALPVRQVRSLKQFGASTVPEHRIHVRGVVTCYEPGIGLYLREESGSLYAETSQKDPFKPGDLVDAVGFVALQGDSLSLQHASVRLLGQEAPPRPVTISAKQALTGDFDSDLVRMDATLLTRVQRRDGLLLALQSEELDFEARLSEPQPVSFISWLQPGSALRLTGICIVRTDEQRQTKSVHLLARSSADIEVLRLPSLWTRERTFQILAAMAVVALVILLWAQTLRRRVQEQTALVQKRLESEATLEEQYRLVWDNSVDAMRLTDGQGRIVRVNEAFCRLVEKAKPDLEGQLLTTIHARDNHAHVLESYLAHFQARTIRTHLVQEVVLSNGKALWLETSNSMFEVRGQIPLVLSVMRDVSERKREETQRLALERKLLDAQRLESLGVLAGGIAHDFNNLLTAILGNSGLLAMEIPETSPSRPLVDGIEKTCRLAAGLCNQMLAYSGRGGFEIRNLNLNTLVEDMHPLVSISVSKKCIVDQVLAPQLPTVSVDPSQIRQLVMNLIINASEAIGENPGRITIRTGVMEATRDYLSRIYPATDLAEGRYVFLEVSDTGAGMTREVMAKIFEPFFTTKFTGRGLGLAAVLGIVRGHRGALRVESAPGQGTTFRLLLPPIEVAPEPLRSTPSSIRQPWKAEGRVLVVDDEQSVRLITSRLLKTLGFEPIAAEDGVAGLELFRSPGSSFSAVLLDMTMPRMNGEETFKEMRAANPNARVILMSGYNEHDATQRFQGLGLAGFLQKPFGPDDLRAKLQAVLSVPPP